MSAKKVDFLNLDYLQHGTPRQSLSWEDLQTLDVMRTLMPYQPVLAGTIPIGIDVPGSDLDIICFVATESFDEICQGSFHRLFGLRGHCRADSSMHHQEGEPYILAQFQGPHFAVEIFGQAIPVAQQNAYRHMVIEHRLLQERSDDFRKQIIALKESGSKTVLAFAQALRLPGDPYDALLTLKAGSET